MEPKIHTGKTINRHCEKPRGGDEAISFVKKIQHCRVPIFLFMLFVLSSFPVSGLDQRDRFVFTQLKYNGDWDPYPFLYQDIYSLMTLTTSIKILPEKRVVTLNDKLLFYSPFVIMLNNGSFAGFTEKERTNLRNYINNGGLLMIEDSSGQKYSRFDKAIRDELHALFPENKTEKIDPSNAVYRAFYLLKNVSGRRLINNYLECVNISGRTAVIYSQNDLFGCWARDSFGNYFYECSPGGNEQRFEAQKLTVNIIIFSLTGTYKNDVIHKPFIEEKLR